jgi:hypothetical protein
MRRVVLARLAALLVALTAIAVVAVAAYHWGASNAPAGAPMMRGISFRGRMGAVGFEPGVGLFGLLCMVVVGLLFVWLLAALLSPNRGGPASPGTTAGDLGRLHDLAELHDSGKLTDDEFTAAKRKLLGLQ